MPCPPHIYFLDDGIRSFENAVCPLNGMYSVDIYCYPDRVEEVSAGDSPPEALPWDNMFHVSQTRSCLGANGQKFSISENSFHFSQGNNDKQLSQKDEISRALTRLLGENTCQQVTVSPGHVTLINPGYSYYDLAPNRLCRATRSAAHQLEYSLICPGQYKEATFNLIKERGQIRISEIDLWALTPQFYIAHRLSLCASRNDVFVIYRSPQGSGKLEGTFSDFTNQQPRFSQLYNPMIKDIYEHASSIVKALNKDPQADLKSMFAGPAARAQSLYFNIRPGQFSESFSLN